MTDETKTAAGEAAADLSVYFPSRVEVEIGDESFVLEAFTAKHLTPYLEINHRLETKTTQLGKELAKQQLRTYRKELEEAVANGDVLPEPPVLTEDNVPMDLLHARCYDEYVELAKLATGKPTEWVEQLGIIQLISLAAVIHQLNIERHSKKSAALTVKKATRQG